MTRFITLCADDYGLHPAVNEGILELVEQHRLSAVSCMSQSPLWPQAAAALSPYRSRLAVGLHFNLTERLVATDRPLRVVLARALLRRLDRSALARNLHQQLDLFEAHWHGQPDYVDGHQHVHALPGIRTVFLQVLKERYGAHLPTLRDPASSVWGADAPLKNFLLHWLCGHFHKQAFVSGFRFNSAFAGAYSLSEKADIAALFAVWLHRLPEGGLLMCHPAKEGSSTAPCAHLQARYREFTYLASADFMDLLRRLDVHLSAAVPAYSPFAVVPRKW